MSEQKLKLDITRQVYNERVEPRASPRLGRCTGRGGGGGGGGSSVWRSKRGASCTVEGIVFVSWGSLGLDRVSPMKQSNALINISPGVTRKPNRRGLTQRPRRTAELLNTRRSSGGRSPNSFTRTERDVTNLGPLKQNEVGRLTLRFVSRHHHCKNIYYVAME